MLQESVWERKLTLLIQEDPAYQAISHESAAVLRAWFRSSSYKLIYKVRALHIQLLLTDSSCGGSPARRLSSTLLPCMQLLVSLGVWPEGIWREQPSHQHKQRCSGRMYKVGLCTACFSVHRLALHARLQCALATPEGALLQQL